MIPEYYSWTFPALIISLLSLLSCFIVYHFIWPRPSAHSLRTVTILVLGDIGRSPRMMYHAESFATMGFITDIVGYSGSKPTPSLERLPKVQIHYIAEFPKSLNFLPFVLLAPLKVSHQMFSIFFELFFEIRVAPEFLLVQNPPTIPTLAIAAFVGWARGSKVIIDWHNLGYSILALKLGLRHPFVKIAKRFEQYYGQKAFAHIFVTKAMHDRLCEEWNLVGHKIILHDRPPKHFHRCSPQDTHDLFMKLEPKLNLAPTLSAFLPEFSAPYTTPFTTTNTRHTSPPMTMGGVRPPTAYASIDPPSLRPDRPALLVSSTSWTADEDFSILLRALDSYEMKARELNEGGRRKVLPQLLTVVTGKGPLRKKYMKEIGRLERDWRWVRCISMWLESRDYPVLLGCADLGVSLHMSSSNLDLPMKVVDMFGCGLPVCALDFECLGELVKPGINGLTFHTSDELAIQLEDLFTNFPNSTKLTSLQRSLSEDTTSRNGWGTWEDNWNKRMKPLLLRDYLRS